MTATLRFRRPAVAALWALAVLTCVSAFSAVAVSRFVSGRQQVDAHRNRIQADWLARGGYELAVDRLLTDPKDYTGETTAPISGSEVKIKVTSVPEKKDVYRIEIAARYPVEERNVVVRTVQRSLKRVEGPKGTKIESVRDEP